MFTSWKSFTFAAALCAALAAAPFTAAQEDPQKIVERLNQMDASIQESFDNLVADMKNLQRDVLLQRKQLDALRTQVRDLEGDLSDLQRKLPDDIRRYAPVDRNSLDEVAERLARIEQHLVERPTDRGLRLAPPSVGRIMLVNRYHEDLVFTINGQAYRVPAGQSQQLDNVPAGAVAYEMISPTWGRRVSTQTTLPPNETLTLTAQ